MFKFFLGNLANIVVSKSSRFVTAPLGNEMANTLPYLWIHITYNIPKDNLTDTVTFTRPPRPKCVTSS